MLNKNIDKFLEENNMTYLYLLLANLEADRLISLPFTIRKNFEGKLTSQALDHIALNKIPDYIIKETKEKTSEESSEEE